MELNSLYGQYASDVENIFQDFNFLSQVNEDLRFKVEQLNTQIKIKEENQHLTQIEIDQEFAKLREKLSLVEKEKQALEAKNETLVKENVATLTSKAQT